MKAAHLLLGQLGPENTACENRSGHFPYHGQTGSNGSFTALLSQVVGQKPEHRANDLRLDLEFSTRVGMPSGNTFLYQSHWVKTQTLCQ